MRSSLSLLLPGSRVQWSEVLVSHVPANLHACMQCSKCVQRKRCGPVTTLHHWGMPRSRTKHGRHHSLMTWYPYVSEGRDSRITRVNKRVGKHKSWNHKVGTAPNPMTSPCTHPPYSSSSYWTKVTLSLQRYCIRPALHPCGAIRTLLRVNLEATPSPAMGEGAAIFLVYATLTLVTSIQPCKAFYVDPWIPLPSSGDPWYTEFVMHHDSSTSFPLIEITKDFNKQFIKVCMELDIRSNLWCRLINGYFQSKKWSYY